MWRGSRAERHVPIILPVIAEYTEEKTTDGEHPLAFRESPTILAASATYEEAVQARLDAEKRLYDPFLAKYHEENS